MASTMSGTSDSVTYNHGSEEREREPLPNGFEESDGSGDARPSIHVDEFDGYNNLTKVADGHEGRPGNMTEEALLLYFTKRGMPEAGLNMVQNVKMNGKTWVEYVAIDPTTARQTLIDELGMAGGFMVQLLLTEALQAHASTERDTLLEGEKRDEERQLRLMNSTLSTPSTGDSRESNDQDKGKISAERTVALIRADLCPKIGNYAAVDGFPTSIQLKVLKVELSGWVETHSRTLAGVIRDAMTAGEDPVPLLMARLNEVDLLLDVKLGGCLFMTPNEKIKRHFLEDSKRTYQGRTSAVQFLWEIQAYVNYQSSTRSRRMITKFLSEDPVSDPRLLLKKTVEFEENCDIMTSVGGIDPHMAGLAMNVLENLTSKLVADPQWNQLLNIPLGMVKYSNPDDVPGMIRVMKTAGRDMQLYVSNMPRSTPNQRNRYNKNHQAVMAFDKLTQICFNYREGKPCSQGALCTFSHKDATGKVCDDKAYTSSGFCGTFGDCKNKHPWDSAKWGKPEQAVEKMLKQDSKFNGRKAKTYLGSIMMMDPMSAEEMEQLQSMHYDYMNMVGPQEVSAMEVDQLADQVESIELTNDVQCPGSMAEDAESGDNTPQMSLTPEDVLTGDDEPDGGTVDWNIQRVKYLMEGVHPEEMHAAFEESLSDADMSVDTDQADKMEGIDSGSDEQPVQVQSDGSWDGSSEVTSEEIISDADKDDGSDYDVSSDVQQQEILSAIYEVPFVRATEAMPNNGTTGCANLEKIDGKINPADFMTKELPPLVPTEFYHDQGILDTETQEVVATLGKAGWTSQEVTEWLWTCQEQTRSMRNLEKAMMDNSICTMSMEGAPKLLVMLDSGTFQHVWGRQIRQYLSNVRNCKPTPVKTAGGVIWLTEVGDLVLADGILEQGFLNDHMEGSLISTGRLSLFDGWKFTQDHRGHVITDVWTGAEKIAWRQGVLHYLPQSMFASTTQNAVNTVVPTQLSMMFDEYQLTEQLTQEELEGRISYHGAIVNCQHPHRQYTHFGIPDVGELDRQMRRQNSHFKKVKDVYENELQGYDDHFIHSHWSVGEYSKVESRYTTQSDKRVTYLLRLLGMRGIRQKVQEYSDNIYGLPHFGPRNWGFDWEDMMSWTRSDLVKAGIIDLTVENTEFYNLAHKLDYHKCTLHEMPALVLDTIHKHVVHRPSWSDGPWPMQRLYFSMISWDVWDIWGKTVKRSKFDRQSDGLWHSNGTVDGAVSPQYAAIFVGDEYRASLMDTLYSKQTMTEMMNRAVPGLTEEYVQATEPQLRKDMNNSKKRTWCDPVIQESKSRKVAWVTPTGKPMAAWDWVDPDTYRRLQFQVLGDNHDDTELTEGPLTREHTGMAGCLESFMHNHQGPVDLAMYRSRLCYPWYGSDTMAGVSLASIPMDDEQAFAKEINDMYGSNYSVEEYQFVGCMGSLSSEEITKCMARLLILRWKEEVDRMRVHSMGPRELNKDAACLAARYMTNCWRRFKKKGQLIVNCVRPSDQEVDDRVGDGLDVLGDASGSQVELIDTAEDCALEYHLIWAVMMAEQRDIRVFGVPRMQYMVTGANLEMNEGLRSLVEVVMVMNGPETEGFDQVWSTGAPVRNSRFVSNTALTYRISEYRSRCQQDANQDVQSSEMSKSATKVQDPEGHALVASDSSAIHQKVKVKKYKKFCSEGLEQKSSDFAKTISLETSQVPLVRGYQLGGTSSENSISKHYSSTFASTFDDLELNLSTKQATKSIQLEESHFLGSETQGMPIGDINKGTIGSHGNHSEQVWDEDIQVEGETEYVLNNTQCEPLERHVEPQSSNTEPVGKKLFGGPVSGAKGALYMLETMRNNQINADGGAMAIEGHNRQILASMEELLWLCKSVNQLLELTTKMSEGILKVPGVQRAISRRSQKISMQTQAYDQCVVNMIDEAEFEDCWPWDGEIPDGVYGQMLAAMFMSKQLAEDSNPVPDNTLMYPDDLESTECANTGNMQIAEMTENAEISDFRPAL